MFIRQVFPGKLCRLYHPGVLEWYMIVFIRQVFPGKHGRPYHPGVLEWYMIVCFYGRCFLVNSTDRIIRIILEWDMIVYLYGRCFMVNTAARWPYHLGV